MFTAAKKYKVSHKCGVKLNGCDEKGKVCIPAVLIHFVEDNLDRPRMK